VVADAEEKANRHREHVRAAAMRFADSMMNAFMRFLTVEVVLEK
jgi:hypothetical protein